MSKIFKCFKISWLYYKTIQVMIYINQVACVLFVTSSVILKQTAKVINLLWWLRGLSFRNLGLTGDIFWMTCWHLVLVASLLCYIALIEIEIGYNKNISQFKRLEIFPTTSTVPATTSSTITYYITNFLYSQF